MCVDINLNKKFSSDMEMLLVEGWALENNLGIDISIKYELIEISTYKGTCFCTPKDGFRESLENFLTKVLGEKYYFKREIFGDIKVFPEKEKSYFSKEERLDFKELSKKMNWDMKNDNDEN
jgi:hypothetical protein